MKEKNEELRENRTQQKEETRNSEEKAKTGEKKESCPYATRRAIVEGINEVKRFSEEHHIASTIGKTLLTTLAEMALGALKGKVSGAVLEALLRAMNHEQARKEPDRKEENDEENKPCRGEPCDRNAKTAKTFFPNGDDGMPHINGGIGPSTTEESIFDLARMS